MPLAGVLPVSTTNLVRFILLVEGWNLKTCEMLAEKSNGGSVTDPRSCRLLKGRHSEAAGKQVQ